MKTLHIWLMFTLLLLVGCGEDSDSDLLEDYFVKNPRVLAVKIQDPEAQPGDTITMRMLVGGRAIDQQMTANVLWAIDDAEPIFVGEADYTEAFQYQVPADALDGTDWYDLPFFARIQFEPKSLNAYKVVRITRTPQAKNPAISGVQLQYLAAGQPVTLVATNGETVDAPTGISNVALTALTQTLPDGQNDKLIYRWYISLSKNNSNKLYIQKSDKKIEAILGAGAEASEYRRSAVFSLKGEDNDKKIQTGIYDIYLVVRDNAANPQSVADERYGTDFSYLTLRVSNPE